MADLQTYCETLAKAARDASRVLARATSGQKDDWLRRSAAAIRQQTEPLVTANAIDLERAPGYGLSAAATDRLKLTPARLADMAAALEHVATLPDPVGEIIEGHTRPNGLRVTRVRTPLGVVFFIFESRPNVTADAAALCVKSGNAVILRGGKEAFHSNQALHALLQSTLIECGLPPGAVQLVETTDRAAVGCFLGLSQWIDVAIPRGGKSLIERVVAEATMPVIKHYDGVCHVYVDRDADLAMAEAILLNSKAQRPGVCNAAECVLVHADVAARFLSSAGPAMRSAGVEVRGDARVRELLPEAKPATETDYRTEYLDLILSAKVVPDLNAAIEHVNEYGSHHTDSIVTGSLAAARRFCAEVDSAAVMVNASTRFNDGGELGLGAEIGISTDKLHARGPCGLRELTTYKYIVEGSGQIRG